MFGPERRIFPNRRIFHSQGNISLWQGVLVLKGTGLRERLTEGSTELATVYWEGVCYLKLTWEGLVCAWN